MPTGSAPPYDAGAAPAVTLNFKPSINIMTEPFEDDFDRPDSGDALLGGPAHGADAQVPFGLDAAPASRGDAASVDAGDAAALLAIASDAGSAEPWAARPSNLGPNWAAMRTNAWRIENGQLCAENAHNHGVWLNKVLPVNARIEYDAIAFTDNGDLKSEVWGDGKSYATSASYTMASSYLAILGGWHNTIHVLARLNEHGADRKEIHVDKDSDDARQRPVVRGQRYSFKIERTDGKTIRMSVNGAEYFSWTDPAPLAGQGHDHLGFNEWESKVCFDRVKVTPLGG